MGFDFKSVIYIWVGIYINTRRQFNLQKRGGLPAVARAAISFFVALWFGVYRDIQTKKGVLPHVVGFRGCKNWCGKVVLKIAYVYLLAKKLFADVILTFHR